MSRLITTSFGDNRQEIDAADAIFCDFLETFDILKTRSDLVLPTYACGEGAQTFEDGHGERQTIDTPCLSESREISSCNEGNSQSKSQYSQRHGEITEQANSEPISNVIMTSQPSDLQNQLADQYQPPAAGSRNHKPQTTDASKLGDTAGHDTSDGLTRVIVEPPSFRSLSLKTAWANSNVTFTDEERKVLNVFRLRLRNHNTAFHAKFGRQFPVILLSLVSIEPSWWQQLRILSLSKSASKTYICISGLEKSEDIRAFDRLMSQPGYRHLYSPLKLCYEDIQITRPAVPGSYDIDPSFTETLCGSLVTFKDSDGSPRTSTIGGLVELDGQIFGLTTSHRPQDEIIANSEKDVPSLADLITEFANEEPADGDLLQPGTPESSEMPPEDHREDGNPDPLNIGPTFVHGSCRGSLLCQDSDEIWNDWRLISIAPARRLPNIVPGSNSYVQIMALGSLDAASFTDRNYWPVTIISGISGVVYGVLSSNPSYILAGSDNSYESWTIKLREGDLRAGDSGSWVIRESDSSLLGMVIARSIGSAYMISWENIQYSIGKKRGLATDRVALPMFPSDGRASHSRYHAQSFSDSIEDRPPQQYHHSHRDNALDTVTKRLLTWKWPSIHALLGKDLEMLPSFERGPTDSARGGWKLWTKSKHPVAESQNQDFKSKVLFYNADTRKSSASVVELFVHFIIPFFVIGVSTWSPYAIIMCGSLFSNFTPTLRAIAPDEGFVAFILTNMFRLTNIFCIILLGVIETYRNVDDDDSQTNFFFLVRSLAGIAIVLLVALQSYVLQSFNLESENSGDASQVSLHVAPNAHETTAAILWRSTKFYYLEFRRNDFLRHVGSLGIFLVFSTVVAKLLYTELARQRRLRAPIDKDTTSFPERS
ncbi:hypothetical protein CLIM01_04657 [Colletotrichum limetticola]|uniref:Uncharacterized protein n=1 Tax=Colletotrichum limetticola TaxID=1209924 RepID=A0ABQ9Q2F0_9PEZI|nr:hypothetical protein CLIM01_04657 [Colletotrichum limetticola]